MCKIITFGDNHISHYKFNKKNWHDRNMLNEAILYTSHLEYTCIQFFVRCDIRFYSCLPETFCCYYSFWYHNSRIWSDDVTIVMTLNQVSTWPWTRYQHDLEPGVNMTLNQVSTWTWTRCQHNLEPVVNMTLNQVST